MPTPTQDRFHAVLHGYSVRRVSPKDPEGREYVLAEDYNELIDWIADHKTCRWSQDEEGTCHSECGNAFIFSDGGPAENEFRHCPYCGCRLAT